MALTRSMKARESLKIGDDIIIDIIYIGADHEVRLSITAPKDVLICWGEMPHSSQQERKFQKRDKHAAMRPYRPE